MRHLRKLSNAIVVGLALMCIVLMPGCRRGPEEGPTAPTTVATPLPTELYLPHGTVLEPPQHNPIVGITVNSTPPGIVITYNERSFLDLTDESRPILHYSFEADLADSPSRSPVDLPGYEELLGKYDGGRLLEDGSIDTALGRAVWVSGEYFQDDETYSDLRVFAPHPSGAGTLVVSAIVPVGVASPEERLQVIQKLLENVS